MCVCELLVVVSHTAQFYCVLEPFAIVFVAKQAYFESESSQGSCVVNSCTPKAGLGPVFRAFLKDEMLHAALLLCELAVLYLWLQSVHKEAHVLIVIVSLKIIMYEIRSDPCHYPEIQGIPQS